MQGAMGQETLAPTSSTGITAAIRKPTSGAFQDLEARGAKMVVEGGEINYTINGTAPTALAGTNVGFRADIGDVIELYDADQVRNFRCIERVAGNGAKVKVATFLIAE
jgi:hypothetical protein